MKICPYCAYSNREGEFYCEECGQNLLSGVVVGAVATRKFSVGEATNPLNASQPHPTSWGTARFGTNSSVVIKVRDTGAVLELPANEEILVGRYDISNTVNIGLDLTPFGARENGVSRVHAPIRRGEDTLTLVDLNSANGTHLNGQRLTPDQPRVLRDGDEIRLGKLVFHVFFK